MHQIVVDAGPFIHLTQIGEISILRKFPILYTSTSIISEISPAKEIPIHEIRRWSNLKVFHVHERPAILLEKIIRKFSLHPGERDILILANRFSPSILLTDDLDARNAAESLGIEAHGSIGILSYAFYRKWISLKKAEDGIYLLYKRSNLFVTSAIIERAINELRKHR